MTEHEADLFHGIMLDNSIIASLSIDERHMSTPSARKTWNAIQSRYNAHGAVELVSLRGAGIDQEDLRAIGLSNAVPATWKLYEDHIKSRYKNDYVSETISTATDMFKGVAQGDAIEYLEERLTGLQAEIKPFKPHEIKSVLMAGIKVIEERRALNGHLPGIPCGINKIDMYTQGFQDRMYYIIGARPSDGKTALIISMIVAILRDDKKVGFISAESSEKEIAMRMFSNASSVDGSRLKLGIISENEMARITDSVSVLYEKAFWIYDEPNPNITTIERIAREWKRREKIDLLFIDYLQIVGGGAGDRKHERVGDVSSRLKALARHLEIPVIVAAQLNRGTGDFPKCDDLKDSGQIEQDADVIMLLHHDRDEDNNQVKESFINIDKNRDGSKGIAEVKFQGEYTRFRDI